MHVQEACVADDSWQAVGDGVWYVIVPVKAVMHDEHASDSEASTEKFPAEMDVAALTGSYEDKLVRSPASTVNSG